MYAPFITVHEDPAEGRGQRHYNVCEKYRWYFYVIDCIWLKDPEMSQVSLQLPERATHTRRHFSMRIKIILSYCLGQCLISQNRTIL